MAKVTFTDKWLKSKDRLPAEPGTRPIDWDAGLPGLGLRRTDSGAATFVVVRRIVPGKPPVRRTIGRPWKVPLPKGAELPFRLAEVRDEARTALNDMAAGIDPQARKIAAAHEREAAELANRRREENTFETIAERFISDHVAKLRSRNDVTRAIRRELIPKWGAMPIVDIRRQDVVKVIRAVARDRLHTAHHLLAYCKKLWGWAIAADEVDGLEHSPCDRIKAKDFLPERKARQRILSDAELSAFWTASSPETIGAVWSAYARILLLTAQRLREVGNATWDEFDLDQAIWKISEKRMKANRRHLVPLSPVVVTILSALPRGAVGPYVFSTTEGERPIQAFSQLKARLDDLMPFSPDGWRLHDLRRTARTHFGAIPVDDHVRERVIAHSQGTLKDTYDLFEYAAEKRFLLDRWASRLLGIVEPAPANVVSIASARS